VRKHQIELDGLVTIAQEKRPPGNRVLIRHISKEKLDQKMRVLAQFRRKPFFLKTSEVFHSGPTVHVVCEYVENDDMLHMIWNAMLDAILLGGVTGWKSQVLRRLVLRSRMPKA
jgi:hypothetical protein